MPAVMASAEVRLTARLAASVLAVLVASSVPAVMVAQGARPDPDHARLAAMAGTWDVEMTFWLRPGAAGVLSKGVSTIQPLFGGLFIEEKIEGALNGTPFTTLAWTGFNTSTRRYEATRIASTNPVRIAETGVYDETTKQLELKGDYAIGADTWHQRTVIQPTSADAMVATSYLSFGSVPEWKSVEIKYTRRAAASGPRVPIPQQLAFAPYHASGVYAVGDTVGWTVTRGTAPMTYAYRWTIRRNNAVVLKEGRLDLSTGKDRIEIVGDQPEMIYVAIEAVADPAGRSGGPADGAARFEGGNTGRNTGFYALGAAVAPTKIGLSTPRPGDFDAFWDAKLAAQAKIPINATLSPVETDVPAVEMNTFQLDALGSKAHGYVARPARPGKFPAIIQLQYAGVYALNAGAVARRAADGWLMLNVDSHDKLPSDPSGNVPRAYQAIGNTDRETSYFLQMYLRDSRVLDYLFTRPDWDGKTVVLTGGSMGGQQSLMLAGLRPEKISAVLVCVPAGADTNADLHGRKAGYPNWPSDNSDVMKTALYFDTVNFASRIKAPVFAGFGFIDTISPPAGVWTMLNQIHGPVEAMPMIESEHDNLTPEFSRVCPARASEIMDRLVRGGTFTPDTVK